MRRKQRIRTIAEEPTMNDRSSDFPLQPGTSRPHQTTGQSDGDFGLGRRGFLKKTAVTGVAGLTGVAATEEASAYHAADREIELWGIQSSLSPRWSTYEIHMGGSGNHIYRGSHAGGNDSINRDHDKVDGSVRQGNRDSYRHEGNIGFIRANGNVFFFFRPGWETAINNQIIVTGEGSGHHEYYIKVDGNIRLGSWANPSNDHVGGSYVFGNVWGHNTDTYTHTGPIRQLAINGQARVRLI